MAEENRGKYAWSTDKELHQTVDNKIDERVQEFNKRNKFSGNNEVKKEWDTSEEIREELKKKEVEDIKKTQEELKKKEEARQKYNKSIQDMANMNLGTIAYMAATNQMDNITSNLPDVDIDASKTTIPSTTKIILPEASKLQQKNNNEYFNIYNDYKNPELYTPFENASEYKPTENKDYFLNDKINSITTSKILKPTSRNNIPTINPAHNDFDYFGGLDKFMLNLKNDYYDNFNSSNINNPIGQGNTYIVDTNNGNKNNITRSTYHPIANVNNNSPIIHCSSTEELNNLRLNNQNRQKNIVHIDRMLETLGKVPLIAADAIDDTDVAEVYHKIKSKSNSITSSIAYLSANQAARSSLIEFNDDYIKEMIDIMQENGLKSRFKEVKTEIKLNKEGKLEKIKTESIQMGRHTHNVGILRNEINSLGDLECMQSLIGNKRKLADLKINQLDSLAKRPNLTLQQRKIIKVTRKAKEVQNMNLFINQFNRTRITATMLLNLSAGDTEVMQTANSILSVTHMVKQAIGTFYRSSNQLVKHEIAHFTKKLASTPAGGVINEKINEFNRVRVKKQEKKRIEKEKKVQKKQIQRKYKERRTINKIKKFSANTRAGKFIRQTSFKFIEAKRRVVGKIRHSVIGRKAKAVVNSKFGKGVKKVGSTISRGIKSVYSTGKLFTSTAAKMISNFFGFWNNIAKLFAKYIAVFLGACFLIIILADVSSVILDKSVFLLDFANYINKTIEGFFPVVDEKMTKDEFGNDLTEENTIELLSKYEYLYIRELKSLGDQMPKDSGYTDRYGGKFTENYGENVSVNWVDQNEKPISYTTNIKEIMSMASAQMQEDRYSNIMVFNLYCSRLWRISHMYDIHGNLDNAWDYKDRTYKKDGTTYYKVDDSNEKYLYKPGGETKDQMAFCESLECKNKYFCSEKESIKNNRINYQEGHGEHQCYFYEIPIKEAKLENWINAYWLVDKGEIKIGDLVYKEGESWISRDMKFSKNSIDCKISGTYKIEQCDHDDSNSIKKKYLHITGTLTFDTEEIIYEKLELEDKGENGDEVAYVDIPAGVKCLTTTFKYDYDTTTGTMVVKDEKGNKTVLKSGKDIKTKLNTSLCEGHCGGHPYLEVTCKITSFSDDKYKAGLKDDTSGGFDNLGSAYDKRTIYKAALIQKYRREKDWDEEKIEKEATKKTEKKYPSDLIDLDNSRHIMSLVNSSIDIYYDAYEVYKDAGYMIVDSHGKNEKFLKEMDLDKMSFNKIELCMYEDNIRKVLEKKGYYNTSNFIHEIVKKIEESDTYSKVLKNTDKKKFRKYYYKLGNMTAEEILEFLLEADKNKIKVVDFSKENKTVIDMANIKETLIDNILNDEGEYTLNLDTININFLVVNKKEIKEKCVNDGIGHVSMALETFIKRHKVYNKEITSNMKKTDLSDKTAVECLQYVFRSDYYKVINSTAIREQYQIEKSKRKPNIVTVENEILDLSKFDGLNMYSNKEISSNDAFNLGEWSLRDEVTCYHYYNQDWEKDYNITIEDYYNDAVKNLIKAGSIKAPGNIGDKNAILSNQINEEMAGVVVLYAETMVQLGKKGQAIYDQDKRFINPQYFDCSSLTMMAWKQAGLNIGTNTEAQLKWAEKNKIFVSTNSLKGHTLMPGDIIFFDGNSDHYKNVGHVGIYVGNDQMVHASSAAGHVIKVNLSNYIAGKYNNLLGYMSPSKMCSNVPNSTPGCKSQNKTYMPYRTITSTTSWQYKLQKLAKTDPTSRIRMVGDRYCIAIGRYYTQGYNPEVGTKVNVTLANGKVIKCIVGELKSNDHTDPTHRFHAVDGSVIEFVIDDGSKENPITKPSTTFIKNNFKGKVYRIDTLDNILSK